MFKRVTNVINKNTEKNVYDIILNTFKLDNNIVKTDKELYNFICDIKTNILINISNIINKINKNEYTCGKNYEIRYYIYINLTNSIPKIIDLNNEILYKLLIILIYKFIKHKYEKTELLNDTLYILF